MPVSCRGALLLLGGLLLGEVGDFTPCLWFFYMKTPPKSIGGEGYQPICQRYRNQHHFASLYQRQSCAPLYSSYILTPGGGKRPRNKWMYEPQVSILHSGTPTPPDNVVESQVVLQDYTSSSYTKGHLNLNEGPDGPYFPSYSTVGRNDPQSGGEIGPVDPQAKASVRGFDVRRMPLDTVETILQQRLHISQFHTQCR
uniref:Uncharacterized protein n=1 Tax=Hucho hucho TaxID=62062 RepID=A0A4W5NGK2_9TELE